MLLFVLLLFLFCCHFVAVKFVVILVSRSTPKL